MAQSVKKTVSFFAELKTCFLFVAGKPFFMVSDSKMAGIAIVTAGIGIIALFLAQQGTVPIQIRISEINSEHIEKIIEVGARVNWIKEKENYALFELFDGEKIIAIRFNPENKERVILRSAQENGKTVRVLGKVQRYKKQLEIIVQKVTA